MRKLLFCTLLFVSAACMRHDHLLKASDTAPVIVYKAKADYSSYVPVRLSADGSRIAAFPALRDIKQGEYFRYPVKLKKGYWLDQQGVGPTTAFLKLTYPEYAALATAPAPEQLMDMILVKEPFEQMYVCGKASDYKDIQDAINKIIQQGKLQQFRSLLD